MEVLNMSEIIKVSCVQMNSGVDIDENLKVAADFIKEAAAKGAKLIATPENTCAVRAPSLEKVKSSYYQQDHPGLPFFSELASKLGVWILVGSIAVRVSEDKLINRSFLFSDKGDIAAQYDKIHLFDVVLSENETYRESDYIKAGSRAVIAKTPWCSLGMSICYDLRFPHLYRDLAKGGASILAVPAAFTVPTGSAHWEVLLRARAIENGCFVIAPGQVGEHEGGRKTWGHSMIISPWGKILANAEDKVGIISADINLQEVQMVRSKIPSLKHDRSYELVK